MPKVFLTPVLIAGLVLLPSCSGNSEQAKCENLQRVISAQSDEINSIVQSALAAQDDLSVLAILASKSGQVRTARAKNIISAENCFVASEIAEAKDWLNQNGITTP